MLNSEQVQGIKSAIQQAKTQQYMSAYLSGIGANIHLGEKRARTLARQAGVLAMFHAEQDLAHDAEPFAAACQEHYEEIMEAMLEKIEPSAPSLLVPERFANNNGKAIGS